MTTVIAGALVTAVFLVVVVLAFTTVLLTTADQTESLDIAWELQADRLKTRVSISSTCGTKATVRNGSKGVSFDDFSKIDVFARYISTTGDTIAKRLAYPSEWTVSSISGDNFNPNVWDPGEVATLDFTLLPEVQAGTKGTVAVAVPVGIYDSAYFDRLPTLQSCFDLYFHSEASSIGTGDYYQFKNTIPSDGTAATISSVFTPGLTGRVRPTSNSGKFVYPLTDDSQIPASTWNVTYRAKRDKADLGFVWLTTADDISLSSTGDWQDVDLSTYIPVGAAGAIVEVVNTGSLSSVSGVVRGKEDTRDYMSNPAFEEIEAKNHRWQIVKVDSNRLIQGYIENTDIDFKLLGYTIASDPLYFPIPPDVTPGITGAWTTADVSAYVDSDADGVILFIDSVSSGDQDYGIREVGSSYATTDKKLHQYGNTMFLVGINTADQFDAYIESTNVKLYLVGQTKGSVVYYTDDIAVADPPTGSWQELDADDYGIPAAASGLIFLAVDTGDITTTTVTGDVTEGWDEKASDYLSTIGKLGDVQTSDDTQFATDPGLYTSYEFNLNIPTNKTIVSVKVFVEHYEELGIQPSNALTWEVGTGSLITPTVLGTTEPALLIGVGSEATVEWDVTTSIDTPGEANNLKFVIRNNSSNGMKTLVDHVYAVVEYSEEPPAEIGFRHGDSNGDWNKRIKEQGHLQAAVGISDSNIWDEYIGDTGTDVFIAAYTRLIRIDVHADMDVLIRSGDGTVRAALATNVANSANVASTTWQSFTATYAFPGYTVVDQTDYLEIDLLAHATYNTSGESVSVDFRIDDPTLPEADQTRVRVDVP